MRALERLDISRTEVEKDILGPAGQSRSAPSTTKGVSHIFQKEYRLRTMLGFFILGMVQLSGIDGVLYVSLKASYTPQSYHPSTVHDAPISPKRLLEKKLKRIIVCPHSLQPGRSLERRSLISGIWRLGNTRARNLDPCLLLRRCLGSTAVYHYGGFGPLHLHVHYRQPLCIRQCPCQCWCRTMGRHRAHIHLCPHLCRNLGYRRQDLCQ